MVTANIMMGQRNARELAAGSLRERTYRGQEAWTAAAAAAGQDVTSDAPHHLDSAVYNIKILRHQGCINV